MIGMSNRRIRFARALRPFLSPLPHFLLFAFAVPLSLVSAFPPYGSRVSRQSPGEIAMGTHPSPSSVPATLQNRLLPPGVNFSSHRAAFASKLAPPVGDVTGHFPRQSPPQPPQFVANNGPLIRAPDGQFVLASASPQLPHQPAVAVGGGGTTNQPNAFQFSTLNNDSDRSSTTEVPSFPSSDETTGTASSSSPTTESLPTFPPALPVDKSIDFDGDGALSLGEVQYAAFVHHGLSSSVVENLFNEVDHNKDNYLNSLEFNDIRPLVLAKAENAALRYLQNVDIDHNGQLSLSEAQNYILKEYGISNRDVERIWRLVVPSSGDEMDAVLFSKLRRRIRGMSIRLARQIMKGADRDEDGQINLREAQLIAFEQEGIGPGEVVEMLASVDDNNDGQLNAPEFADFERIVRARAVETSKKALKVVDTDGNSALTMDEAKKIAFEHYGFDEMTLEPFFAQADENEDAQLDPVEFAGFRSVIRGRAVKNAGSILTEMDEDGDGMISESEAVQKTRQEDDMSAAETHGLFVVADQDKNGLLDKVELADFIRLVRLTAIKFVADHFRDYDLNRDKLITLDELETLVKERYKLGPAVTRKHFDKADLDRSGDLNAGEVVDFRHEFRRFTQDKAAQKELEEQNGRRETTGSKRGRGEGRQKEEEEEEKEEQEGDEKRSKEEKKRGGRQKGTAGEVGAGQPRKVGAEQLSTQGEPKTQGVGAEQTRTPPEQPRAQAEPSTQGVGAEQSRGVGAEQTKISEGSTTTTSDQPSSNATTLSTMPTLTTSSSSISTASQPLHVPSSSLPANGVASADPSPIDSSSVFSPSPVPTPTSSPAPSSSSRHEEQRKSSDLEKREKEEKEKADKGEGKSEGKGTEEAEQMQREVPKGKGVTKEGGKGGGEEKEEQTTRGGGKGGGGEEKEEQTTRGGGKGGGGEEKEEQTTTTRGGGAGGTKEEVEGSKKRHKKRRRKTTVTTPTTTTTTTTTEAPPSVEEEGDDYEEEEEDKRQK